MFGGACRQGFGGGGLVGVAVDGPIGRGRGRGSPQCRPRCVRGPGSGGARPHGRARGCPHLITLLPPALLPPGLLLAGLLPPDLLPPGLLLAGLLPPGLRPLRPFCLRSPPCRPQRLPCGVAGPLFAGRHDVLRSETRSDSSRSVSSVRADSPEPRMASARARLAASISAMRSSTVPSVTRRWTWTGWVCPMR